MQCEMKELGIVSKRAGATDRNSLGSLEGFYLQTEEE